MMPAAHHASERSIAIASGKGGVGKTWFAITLAHCLAARGERTLLFDGDLGLANVDVQLGLCASRDLGHYVAGERTLPELAIRCSAGEFDVIAGRSGSGSLATLPPPRFNRLLDDLGDLSARYDRVILDLGAGIDAHVRALAGFADTCLVVTTDEPTALTDAYAFIKLTVASRPTSDLRVVVNLVASQREGERTYRILAKACAEFLRFNPLLAGIVRRDPKVRDAIRNQTPFLVRYPAADAAADVRAIADYLSGPS
ncbi:MAG: MinD/ParA family protein [Rhodospirillales bacterium]|nr:MinD/ParA family protein [Rhodospirillales bacterium]